jgi:hypothetical protein
MRGNRPSAGGLARRRAGHREKAYHRQLSRTIIFPRAISARARQPKAGSEIEVGRKAMKPEVESNHRTAQVPISDRSSNPSSILPTCQDLFEGAIAMHSVNCPSCGTRVEVDFLPVAGQVWCPTCQKLFSPRSFLPEQHSGAEQVDQHQARNGRDD